MKNILFNVFKKVVKPLENKGLWKLPLVPIIYEKVYSLITNNSVSMIEYDNLNIYGYHNDSGMFRIMQLNTHNKFKELELFKKLVQGTDFVIDIGANIGVNTLLAGKYMNKNGVVLSFEPN